MKSSDNSLCINSFILQFCNFVCFNIFSLYVYFLYFILLLQCNIIREKFSLWHTFLHYMLNKTYVCSTEIRTALEDKIALYYVSIARIWKI